jgi:hypothetical protein
MVDTVADSDMAETKELKICQGLTLPYIYEGSRGPTHSHMDSMPSFSTAFDGDTIGWGGNMDFDGDTDNTHHTQRTPQRK